MAGLAEPGGRGSGQRAQAGAADGARSDRPPRSRVLQSVASAPQARPGLHGRGGGRGRGQVGELWQWDSRHMGGEQRVSEQPPIVRTQIRREELPRAFFKLEAL